MQQSESPGAVLILKLAISFYYHNITVCLNYDIMARPYRPRSQELKDVRSRRLVLTRFGTGQRCLFGSMKIYVERIVARGHLLEVEDCLKLPSKYSADFDSDAAIVLTVEYTHSISCCRYREQLNSLSSKQAPSRR